jgi:ABC-type transporter Mla maintaining outer membrane lipid asymmetry ATPase subunit MlaF
MQTLEVSEAVRVAVSGITLSPAQRSAADGVLLALKRGNCAVVQDHGSDGKTTVLEEVQREIGGVRGRDA